MAREPIVFAQDSDPDFDALSARIGDLQIAIVIEESGPVVSVYALSRRQEAPCEDDASACPAGKEFNDEHGNVDEERYLECEKTCPHMREVEEIDCSESIWGASLEELVLEVRTLLPAKDYDGQPLWGAPEVVAQFVERDWIVDGKRLVAPSA